jgi:hypothetical protein
MRIVAGVAQQPFDNAAVLHVGSEQTQRHFRDLGPGHPVAVSERGVGCDQQTVPFAIKWNRCHTAERFVIEISEAGIDLQIFQERENFDRCARQNSTGPRDGARETAS